MAYLYSVSCPLTSSHLIQSTKMGLRSCLARLRKNSKSLSKRKPSENVSELPQVNETEKAGSSDDDSSPAADQETPAGTDVPKRRKRDLLKKVFKGIGCAGVGLLIIPLVPLIIAFSICDGVLGLVLTTLWNLVLKPLLLFIILPYELVSACFCQ